MTDIETTRVIFIQVNSASAKVQHIVQKAQTHFSRKERFLIIVDDDKAASYTDELLWHHTAEIFLPHAIYSSETQEWIAITKEKKNINNARYAFNLCSTPLLTQGSFRVIYDFDDATSPHKKNLSETRFEAYKQARFLIESTF